MLMYWKMLLLVLVMGVHGGCMSSNMPNYETNYYDDWSGSFDSEIKLFQSDSVYQFRIGYENPNKGKLLGFEIQNNETPSFPDFIEVNIDGVSFSLSDLTPEVAAKFSYLGPRKAGYFQYGDAVSFKAKGMEIKFYNGKPVYLYCNGERTVFTNVLTGHSGSLPMSIRKMKLIFGNPSRVKKEVVL